MKRLCSLFKKDVILGIRNVYILLEIFFAVFVTILLVFIIPEDIKIEGRAYIYDETKVLESFIAANAAEEARRKGDYFVDSREEVIEGMREHRSAVGLIMTEKDNGRYGIQLLTQPYTTDAVVRYVDTEMEDFLSIIKPPRGVYPPDVYGTIRITALQSGLRDELPFNQRLLPPILLHMVGMMGVFAMVSLVGQERSDGTIRAFRASPASMWSFLLSKHLVLLATGFVTFSTLYLSVMGFGGYLPALLVMALTIIMGSSIGVILGGIFDNPMGAILWVLLLMIVLALPVVSLFVPVFSPEWLKLIPSFHTLFALDAAMFPDDNSHIIWQGLAALAGVCLVLFPLSGLIFGRLTRRGV